jgi:hypothetical protein
LHFQDQTTNTCAFLLINGPLNEDKELNLTINHKSPRVKRFANYVLKTGMEGVLIIAIFFLDGSLFSHIFKNASIMHACVDVYVPLVISLAVASMHIRMNPSDACSNTSIVEYPSWHIRARTDRMMPASTR